MDLLDLPNDVFQLIIEELILDEKFAGAWKYRAVCRTFACSIRSYIFSGRHSLDRILQMDGWGLIDATVENKQMFLYQRLDNGLGVHSSVRSKIIKMANWLVQQVRDDTASDMDDFRKRLCFATAITIEFRPHYSRRAFLDVITNGHYGPYPSPNSLPTLEEQYVAAVVMNRRDLMEKTLQTCSVPDIFFPYAPELQESVRLAGILGYIPMINSIVQYAGSTPAVYRNEWQCAVAFGLLHAARYAIRTTQHDIVGQIAALFPVHFQGCSIFSSQGYLQHYSTLTCSAIASRDIDMLSLVLDLGREGPILIHDDHFSNICSLGNVPIMSKLLKMRIKWDWSSSYYYNGFDHPVDVAIAYGDPPMLAAVLEAVSEYEMGGSASRCTEQPFLTAISSRNVYAVKTLLERAKTVHHVDLPYELILQEAVDQQEETISNITRQDAIALGKHATSYVSAARTGKVRVYEVKGRKPSKRRKIMEA